MISDGVVCALGLDVFDADGLLKLHSPLFADDAAPFPLACVYLCQLVLAHIYERVGFCSSFGWIVQPTKQGYWTTSRCHIIMKRKPGGGSQLVHSPLHFAELAEHL